MSAAPTACPFCHSTETEMLSLFGSQLLTSQYYCRRCKTAFEAVRWDAKPARSKGSAASGYSGGRKQPKDSRQSSALHEASQQGSPAARTPRTKR